MKSKLAIGLICSFAFGAGAQTPDPYEHARGELATKLEKLEQLQVKAQEKQYRIPIFYLRDFRTYSALTDNIPYYYGRFLAQYPQSEPLLSQDEVTTYNDLVLEMKDLSLRRSEGVAKKYPSDTFMPHYAAYLSLIPTQDLWQPFDAQTLVPQEVINEMFAALKLSPGVQIYAENKEFAIDNWPKLQLLWLLKEMGVYERDLLDKNAVLSMSRSLGNRTFFFDLVATIGRLKTPEQAAALLSIFIDIAKENIENYILESNGDKKRRQAQLMKRIEQVVPKSQPSFISNRS